MSEITTRPPNLGEQATLDGASRRVNELLGKGFKAPMRDFLAGHGKRVVQRTLERIAMNTQKAGTCTSRKEKVGVRGEDHGIRGDIGDVALADNTVRLRIHS